MRNIIFILLCVFLPSISISAQSINKFEPIHTHGLLERIDHFIADETSRTYDKMIRSYPNRSFAASKSDSLIISVAFNLIFNHRKKYIEDYGDFTGFYLPIFTKKQYAKIFGDLKDSALSNKRKTKIYPFDYFIDQIIINDSLESILFSELENKLQNAIDCMLIPCEAEGNIICHAINQGNKKIENRLLSLIERDFKKLLKADWNNISETSSIAVYVPLFYEIYSKSFWQRLIKLSHPLATRHGQRTPSFAGSIISILNNRLKLESTLEFEDIIDMIKPKYAGWEFEYTRLEELEKYLIENPDCWVYLMDEPIKK